MADGLSLTRRDGNWQLVGANHGAVALANEYLSYLADRNYSSPSAPPKAPAKALTSSDPSPVVDAKAFHGHGDLAFVSRDRLYVLDGTTGKLTAVTSGAEVASAPALSPDGKWLAYSVGQSGAGVVRADGTSARAVTATGAGRDGCLTGGSSSARRSTASRPRDG